MTTGAHYMTDRDYDLKVGTCKTHGPNTPMTSHGLCNINRLDQRAKRRKANGPIYIYKSKAKGRVILSPEERAKMMDEAGCCALCESTEDLHIDHCHLTGEFRGVLCRGCNIALGIFKDDVSLLIKAIDYLGTNGVDQEYITARVLRKRS